MVYIFFNSGGVGSDDFTKMNVAPILYGPYTVYDIPNIDDLISDTHKLRIQYEYTHKQCVDVAIEGMDIWYMGIRSQGLC